MVLRKMRTAPAFGARRRAQHRDRAAGDLRALLFERSTPPLRCLRHGHGGANLKHPELNAAAALALDARDPLSAYAAEFHHPYDAAGRKMVYLCGHSLGLQAKSAASYVEQELADWRRLGVLGHHAATRPWIGYHEALAAPLAELVGAAPSEVVAMNSLTVNLHLMMVTFFRPSGSRNRVLMEKSAFPKSVI